MNKEFAVQRLNPEGVSKANKIATLFDDLLNELTPLIGYDTAGTLRPSREELLVRLKLEEASFFAKKALSNIVANQKVG